MAINFEKIYNIFLNYSKLSPMDDHIYCILRIFQYFEITHSIYFQFVQDKIKNDVKLFLSNLNYECCKLYKMQIFQKMMYIWKKLTRMSWSNKTGYASRNTPNKVRENNYYISCWNVLQFLLYLSNYMCYFC